MNWLFIQSEILVTDLFLIETSKNGQRFLPESDFVVRAERRCCRVRWAVWLPSGSCLSIHFLICVSPPFDTTVLFLSSTWLVARPRVAFIF